MEICDMNKFQRSVIDSALGKTSAWLHDGFEETVICNTIGGCGEGLAWIVCPWDDDKAPEGAGFNPLDWAASIWLADWESGEMGGVVYNGTYGECLEALERLCGGAERVYSDDGERTYPTPARDITIDPWWPHCGWDKPMSRLAAEQ